MLGLTAGLFCLILGCNDSVGYGNEGINLPDIPPYVRQQQGLTPLPNGPLKTRDVAPLITKLRISEVKKDRALRLAIKEREYLIWLYKQKAGSRY